MGHIVGYFNGEGMIVAVLDQLILASAFESVDFAVKCFVVGITECHTRSIVWKFSYMSYLVNIKIIKNLLSMHFGQHSPGTWIVFIPDVHVVLHLVLAQLTFPSWHAQELQASSGHNLPSYLTNHDYIILYTLDKSVITFITKAIHASIILPAYWHWLIISSTWGLMQIGQHWPGNVFCRSGAQSKMGHVPRVQTNVLLLHSQSVHLSSLYFWPSRKNSCWIVQLFWRGNSTRKPLHLGQHSP